MGLGVSPPGAECFRNQSGSTSRLKASRTGDRRDTDGDEDIFDTSIAEQHYQNADMDLDIDTSFPRASSTKLADRIRMIKNPRIRFGFVKSELDNCGADVVSEMTLLCPTDLARCISDVMPKFILELLQHIRREFGQVRSDNDSKLVPHERVRTCQAASEALVQMTKQY